jgi:AraC-like DNA-binding protein
LQFVRPSQALSRSEPTRPQALSRLTLQSHDLSVRSRVESYRIPIVIEWCETVEDVFEVGSRRTTWAVIMSDWDRDGASTSAVMTALTRQRPTLPIGLWCDQPPPASWEVPCAIPTFLLPVRGSPTEKLVLTALGQGWEFTLEDSILRLIQDWVPPELQPILEYCLVMAPNPETVAQVAHRFGVPQRSLSYRLAHHGIPTAQDLLAWRRILSSGWDLAHTELSVEHIASRHGYASASALRTSLRRLTGFRPSEVRHPGAFRWLSMRLEQLLGRRAMAAQSRGV